MDIHYLCDEAPCDVPAEPWTTVTRDGDLVSHLVSLYLAWNWPFSAFLDKEVFLKHMRRAEAGSEFCSSFLVNAVLSNACVSLCIGFCILLLELMLLASISRSSPRLMLFRGISRLREVISWLRLRG